MDQLRHHPAWNRLLHPYLAERKRLLTQKVLGGLEPDKYREAIGAINEIELIATALTDAQKARDAAMAREA